MAALLALALLLPVGDSAGSFMRHDPGSNAVQDRPYLVAGEFEDRMTLSQARVCNKVGCRHVTSSDMRSSGQNDIYVAKYSGGGELIWASQIGGRGDDRLGGITLHSFTGLNHMRRSLGEPAYPLKIEAGTSSDEEQPLYATGTIQGTAVAGSHMLIQAASSLSRAPFLARLNASDGYLHWARAMAHCGANRSFHAYQSVDPRTLSADTFGECRVEGVSTDGNGDVVVAGSLFGWLRFPAQVNFSFLPREYFGTIHQQALDPTAVLDPVEAAVGFPNISVVFPGISTASFVLEVEKDETGASLKAKISEALQVPPSWVGLLVNDGTPPPAEPQPGDPGYSEFNPKVYDRRWDLGEGDSAGLETIEARYMRVQICNASWVANMTLLNTSICSVALDTGGDEVLTCPTDCEQNSDCVGESICVDRICQVLRTVCLNISTSVVQTNLESRISCTKGSGSGRECAKDQWIAKFDKDGLFRWAGLRHKIVLEIPEVYNEYLTAERATSGREIEAFPEDFAERTYEMAYWSKKADELSMWADARDDFSSQGSATGF